MSAHPPIQAGKPPTDEQKRLVAVFDEMERQQVEFLQEAGKRIIELVTALLGLLFAVMAFGGTFPPAYLQGNDLGKAVAVVTLVFYLAAMGFALRTVQPRKYQLYRHNLTEMRTEFDKIVAEKALSVQFAGACFGLGSVLLAGLIITIIFAA